MNRLKKFIPNRWKQHIKSLVQPHNMSGDYKSTTRRKVFIALAADYGNLGDVAISFAQYNFIKYNFPEWEIVDVPISRTLKNIRTIKRFIQCDDVITIVGGGNFTNKYQEIEDLRLMWISSFPNNRIVIFPQTMDFSDDDLGVTSFNKSKKIIESHSNLHLFLRESRSYQLAKATLNSNIYLCPDIVLSLDKSTEGVKRNGYLSCIRNDNESNFSKTKRKSLLAKFESVFMNDIHITDTHIGVDGLSVVERTRSLFKIGRILKRLKLL